MIEAVINQFGVSIGVIDLALNEEGVVQLSLENTGDFFIEKIQDGVLVYLTKKLDYPSAKLYWNALSLCYAQESYPFLVNPIFTNGNQVGFVTQIKEEFFTLQSINQSIDFFTELQQKLFNMS